MTRGSLDSVFATLLRERRFFAVMNRFRVRAQSYQTKGIWRLRTRRRTLRLLALRSMPSEAARKENKSYYYYSSSSCCCCCCYYYYYYHYHYHYHYYYYYYYYDQPGQSPVSPVQPVSPVSRFSRSARPARSAWLWPGQSARPTGDRPVPANRSVTPDSTVSGQEPPSTALLHI